MKLHNIHYQNKIENTFMNTPLSTENVGQKRIKKITQNHVFLDFI